MYYISSIYFFHQIFVPFEIQTHFDIHIPFFPHFQIWSFWPQKPKNSNLTNSFLMHYPQPKMNQKSPSFPNQSSFWPWNCCTHTFGRHCLQVLWFGSHWFGSFEPKLCNPPQITWNVCGPWKHSQFISAFKVWDVGIFWTMFFSFTYLVLDDKCIVYAVFLWQCLCQKNPTMWQTEIL